ncbi:MAG: hypothetical protein H6574_18775 [Lewinellaceae bacterium]|nr:hypothetical protein [Lewinellaceae bacterium]
MPGDPKLIRSARKAAPKHRTERNFTGSRESQSLDQPFVEHNIPEAWVRDSENPEYQAAYDEKTAAQKELAEAPEKYKEIEILKIEQSEQSFNKTVNTAKASMVVVCIRTQIRSGQNCQGPNRWRSTCFKRVGR